MIRFLFRFLGLILLAAAFILVIYDGTKSIAGNSLALTTVQALWELINPAQPGEAQTADRALCPRPLVGPGDGCDPGGAGLEPARSSRHPAALFRPQEKAADRLRALARRLARGVNTACGGLAET